MSAKDSGTEEGGVHTYSLAVSEAQEDNKNENDNLPNNNEEHLHPAPPVPLTTSIFSYCDPLFLRKRLIAALATSTTPVVTTFTVICAFSAYFAIYGISVSLFAATFEGITVFGSLQLKVAFTIAQMLGYAVSKVIATFVIPTIRREQRCLALVGLAVLGEIPLVFFGMLPPIGQVIMVFLSGMPMAWLWGIMVMYLEGRRTSEVLLMGLYLSVMVASGVAKSVAAAVMDAGISENWMPAICGSVSALLFILFIVLLDTIPDPSDEDKAIRKERRTMSPQEGRIFLRKWAPGLIVITLVYSVLTAYRNFRDYFAPELWRDLEGPNFDPSSFTKSELPVGICTAVAYSMLYFIKDDRRAFFAILGVMFLGGVVVFAATVIQVLSLISALPWMIMVGTGLFMAYIPPGAMLYDRFNGATNMPYTSVFMMYLSDICGYTATLTVLFYRNFGDANLSYVSFFHSFSYIAAMCVMVGMTIAAVYFVIAFRKMDKGIKGGRFSKLEEEPIGFELGSVSA